MSLACINQLLKETDRELLQERRSVDRKSFVRPVVIEVGRNRELIHEGFSRDISQLGIGIVSRIEWDRGTLACLRIHRFSGAEIRVVAEVRWSQPYGEDWHLTGWRFIREAGA